MTAALASCGVSAAAPARGAGGAACPQAADLAQVLEVFRRRLTRELDAGFQACVHCGLCADSCHYFLATGDPKMTPAYRLEQIRRIYRRHFDWLGRVAPWWVGAEDLTEKALNELVETAFGTCTACGRCTMNCTVGVNMGLVTRLVRSMLAEAGRVPAGLQATVDVALRTGNQMAITGEEMAETVQWLEEELQADLGDPTARMPLDKAGARVLYAINPREAKYFPLAMLAVAKVFHVVGEDWTLSRTAFDATNYGLFSGDDEAARAIARRLADEVARLGVGVLVMTECGHGYRAMRWEAENWLGKRFTFPVVHVLELFQRYLRQRRLRLNPSRNPKPVTLHDPCNLVRHGGVVEPQRELLRAAALDFREMTPNREQNFCCGGGGGMLAMTEYARRRVEAGRIKAEQIRATGAKVVATPCHNCIDQLMDLNKAYKLGVEIKTVSEILANAILPPGAEGAEGSGR
jgi:Fe-S oxidoreductase